MKHLPDWHYSCQREVFALIWKRRATAERYTALLTRRGDSR
jgi:hypothetical protein